MGVRESAHSACGSGAISIILFRFFPDFLKTLYMPPRNLLEAESRLSPRWRAPPSLEREHENKRPVA